MSIRSSILFNLPSQTEVFQDFGRSSNHYHFGCTMGGGGCGGKLKSGLWSSVVKIWKNGLVAAKPEKASLGNLQCEWCEFLSKQFKSTE